MTVFVVIALSDNPEPLEARIKAQFPNDHLVLAPGRWLVAGDGIAKAISDKLGLDATLGQSAVFAISGYFGWATNAMWEWLALKSLTPK